MMYKSETRRSIEKAMFSMLAEGSPLPNLCSGDADEISQDISLFAQKLTEQLWAEGYELEPRSSLLASVAPGQPALIYY